MQASSPISFKTLFLCVLTSAIIISIIFIQNALDSKTKIVFCNVGEGSAIYIRVHNKVDILINTGPSKKILNCLSAHMPFFDRSIEYILITSSSQNNTQGLVSLLNRYTIDTVYAPESFTGSKNGKIVNSFVEAHNSRLKNIANVRDLNVMNSILTTLKLKNYLGISYEEKSYKAVLLGTIPGRVLMKFNPKILPFQLQNSYLLQVPVYGFSSNPKYDILSLAERAIIVINKQSTSTNLKKLQTLTSHLRALNKNYYISNSKEDVLFTLN